MGEIICTGYDVINILDVMSYLYGCDVMKCSCDVRHTERDVIHIVCNDTQRVGKMQLIPWFDGTDTVDVVSDIEGEMADITFVWSCL